MHYDLEWNPAAMEQQVGRLDRLGSFSSRTGKPIEVLSVYQPRTYEERIARVVQQRCEMLRSLVLAWRMYSDDARDELPFSSVINQSSPEARFAWVQGYMDNDPWNRSNWDVDKDLQKSVLWPYCGNAAGIWRCPADRARVRPAEGPFAGQSVPRVRSFAMSLWVGGLDGRTDGGFSGPGWRVYAKSSDLRLLEPPRSSFFWINVRTASTGATV